MQVIVDKLLTQYDTKGEGRAVLILHGWGDSILGLNEVRNYLAKNFKVIALDLPGFGNSEAPHSTWGLSEYSSFVSKFLTKIQAGPIFAIVAHSNGGAIAMRGLATGSLNTEKLVLLDSAGIRDTYKGRVKLIRLITKAGKALILPFPKAAKAKIRKKVYKTIGSDMLVAENLQETFKKIVTDDVQADAAKLTLPVLLVYGEEDTATPPQYGRQFHELISDSTLEIVGGAGHFVHLDKPENVKELLTEFLK